MFRLINWNKNSSNCFSKWNQCKGLNNRIQVKHSFSNDSIHWIQRNGKKEENRIQWNRTYSNSSQSNHEQVVEATKTNSRIPVGWNGAFIVLALAGVVAFIFKQKSDQKQKDWKQKQIASAGKPALGGPFTLVDHDGNPVTNNQFEGKFMLIYFGFTNCPDICPTELTKLSKALDILDQKGLLQHIQPLFVTVDPMRDSVGKVREYVSDFHPKLLGLTGTPDQIQAMCKEYRVYMSKANEKLGEKDEDDYLVDHSIIFYLMDPRGEFDSHYGASANEFQMADKIGEIVKNYFNPQTLNNGWFDWFKK